MDSSFWVLATVSAIFIGCAVYAGSFWSDVRDMRGLALTVVATCAAFIAGVFALFYAGDLVVHEQMILVQINDVLIPARWLSLVQQVAWIPFVVFFFILVDMWAADHNSHQSVTARTYLWYSSLRGGR